MKYIYLSVLILLLSLSSCEKDDADNITIILTPSEYQFSAEAGDYFAIGIKIESEVALGKLNFSP